MSQRSSTRWTHKPDCPPNRARVLHVGRAAVCRGCTCLWLGAGFGALAAWLDWFGVIGAGLLLAAGLIGLAPRLYAALSDPARDIARFGLGAGPLPFAFGAVRAGLWYPGAVLLWCAGVVVYRSMHGRGLRRARPCGSCDECRSSSRCEVVRVP